MGSYASASGGYGAPIGPDVGFRILKAAPTAAAPAIEITFGLASNAAASTLSIIRSDAVDLAVVGTTGSDNGDANPIDGHIAASILLEDHKFYRRKRLALTTTTSLTMLTLPTNLSRKSSTVPFGTGSG